MAGYELKYPEEYRFANLLNHYLCLHLPAGVDFRMGDWLQFLHKSDLDALVHCLEHFNEAGPSVHQDIMLTCGLLFSRETGKTKLDTDPRLGISVIRQFGAMLQLEHLRRKQLLFIEQRLSIRPNFNPQPLLTRKGREFMREHGSLPTAPQTF